MFSSCIAIAVGIGPVLVRQIIHKKKPARSRGKNSKSDTSWPARFSHANYMLNTFKPETGRKKHKISVKFLKGCGAPHGNEVEKRQRNTTNHKTNK